MTISNKILTEKTIKLYSALLNHVLSCNPHN